MDPEIILFDEPTSALDPTMVGEVEAVIRDLAKSGKTMMVVTHEMDFARQISNRVFFMDEGGIYEDGSPEQIFENPVGENTRRFIKKLKIMEMDIRSRDYDFRGAITDIEQYCYKNHIEHRTCMHIEAVVEELCQNILLERFKKPEIHVQVEYSEINAETTIKVCYKGETFNPSDTKDKLAYKVLSGIAKSISLDEGNTVTILL